MASEGEIRIGGRFKNTYELLNLRALKFSPWIKSTSFNVWVRYFVWNFKGTLWNSTRNIWPIHWKIRFLYNMEILRALRFKSSYEFLKRPLGEDPSFGITDIQIQWYRTHTSQQRGIFNCGFVIVLQTKCEHFVPFNQAHFQNIRWSRWLFRQWCITGLEFQMGTSGIESGKEIVECKWLSSVHTWWTEIT